MSDTFEGAVCGVDGCAPSVLDQSKTASDAKTKLSIEVISDAICPWCWVAKRRLDRAISALAPDIAASVTWRPFELNPGMPKAGVDRRAYRSAKFGSWQHSQALDTQVAAAGRPDGLVFNHDRIERTPNTVDAHRLIWLAGQQGKQDAVVEALFAAYFNEGRDVGDPDVLADVGAARLHRAAGTSTRRQVRNPVDDRQRGDGSPSSENHIGTRETAANSHSPSEEQIMVTVMLMSVLLIAGLCVLAYTLAVYALPFMLGLTAAQFAYQTGSGLIGAGLVGVVAGAAAFGILALLFDTLRPPILRLIVALVFAAPAAVAGYALVHGVTKESVPSEIWRQIFCIVGGGFVGVSALLRLAGSMGQPAK